MRVIVYGLVAAAAVAIGSAQADCVWQGQRFPPGATVCVDGKVNICRPNDTWGVEHESRCYRQEDLGNA